MASRVRARLRPGRLVAAVATAAAGRAVYRQVVKGALTLDSGVGRRVAPLGPLTIDIDAPRGLVFEVIAAPYLDKAGSFGSHIEVLERGADLVVAAHHTPLPRRAVATTVEAVGFDPPREVTFRLLRGPVPHVTERFALDEVGERTRLTYEGEMGTDYWALGELWGKLVGRIWVRTVESSLAGIRQRSEERAAAHRRRSSRNQA